MMLPIAQGQKCDSAERVASRRSEVVTMRVFSSTDLDDAEGTEHNHAKEQYGVGKEMQ